MPAWNEARNFNVGSQCKLFFCLLGDWVDVDLNPHTITDILTLPFVSVIDELLLNLPYAEVPVNGSRLVSPNRRLIMTDELGNLQRFIRDDMAGGANKSLQHLIEEKWESDPAHVRILSRSHFLRRYGLILPYLHLTEDSKNDLKALFAYEAPTTRRTFFNTVGQWQLQKLLNGRKSESDDDTKRFLDMAKRYGLFRVNNIKFADDHNPTLDTDPHTLGGNQYGDLLQQHPEAVGNSKCCSGGSCVGAFMSYYCESIAPPDPGPCNNLSDNCP
jgi:hypothetical protein